MAFWGIEVKPGKPYTHSSKDGTGRLRISQATLAVGSATLKSLVQCNVGDKRPVLLCALLPDKTESLQLDLEFDEAEDVIFSVIGPRGVYLTGYYVDHNRRSHMQVDSESFGEDIANSETEESNRFSDEDEYEDSFINDDEPEPLTPSPVSSSRDEDDEGDLPKNRNENGGRRRLKKRYQSIESDDEMSVPKSDDEDDFPISSVLKNNKSQALAKKTKKETTVDIDNKTKISKVDAVDSRVLDSKDQVDVEDLVDYKTRGKGDHQRNTSLAEVVPESKLKAKKKRRESSKEEIAIDPNQSNTANGDKSGEQKEVKPKKKRKDKRIAVEADAGNHIDVCNTANGDKSGEQKEVKPKKKRKDKRVAVEADAGNHIDVCNTANGDKSGEQKEVKTKKKRKDKGIAVEAVDGNHVDVLAKKIDGKPNDTRGVDHSLEVLSSTEKNSKPLKKRKVHIEENNLLAGTKQEDDQQAIDKSTGTNCKESSTNEKKGKKTRMETRKTREVDENTNMNVENENNKLAEENKEESDSCHKKTLSNGLVIEDLVTGNSKGKVATAGRKVKVQYVVKLKENEQVIDSNGKSPHKFRLGDKQVIEGLNVGLDGMRVGDKRRLTIPPSMSLGYKGTGENVPPNSWLVYDVEVTSIH